MSLNINKLQKLTPIELHKLVLSKYLLKSDKRGKTDIDVIRENHRFLWEDDGQQPETWEEQLAKKYYSKLFKEYCICDLTKYKENKIAMRWRIEQEVVVGKGQFICGNKHCSEKDNLKSWEVNFNYVEHGSKKNALVKLRLCESCSNKLNYHTKKRLAKQKSRRIGPSKLKPDALRAEKEERTANTEENDNEIDVEEGVGQSSSNKETTIQEEPESSLWSSKAPVEEKSREEEFSEFLEDLLL